MSSKKRGRPLGRSNLHRKMLQSPPPYILERMANRNKKLNSVWTPVVASMDEHQAQIRAFGRKYRIKMADVWTILCMNMHGVKSTSVEEALARAQQSWKRMSEAGLRARGYKIPEWHAQARAIILNPSNGKCSLRRLTLMVLSKCAEKKPDERTIRRYLTDLKKTGAYLS
jgi:hypothetical protein